MQSSRKRAHPDTIDIRSGRTEVRPSRAQQCRQAGQRRNTPARDSSNTAAPGDGRTPAAVSRCARPKMRCALLMVTGLAYVLSAGFISPLAQAATAATGTLPTPVGRPIEFRAEIFPLL